MSVTHHTFNWRRLGNSLCVKRTRLGVVGVSHIARQYVANRGYDSIATFAVDSDTGALTLRQHTTTGATPRHFVLAPGGRWLLVACQHSDQVSVYAVDTTTGMLAPTPHVASIGTPSCVLFLED
jgi:6-phosphogluconolactonase